ncbi:MULTISPECIES: HAD family hydrolase [Flavobacteriaceae]|uniref:HAD family hydrolase n=1 Tax=Flavobacteriaceae TaxID=49546 RepID=UPI001491F3E6|nr:MULTISPECIES: HAD family hydrolase [Allomuricauda]MDC6367639.1 HAD hydrolase-like protein [Muricauda sp. AC10]
MQKIKLVVFDLSGTTVEDDNAVAKSLHQAAVDYGLDVPLVEFQKTIGTNKIHLYQYMIAQSKGQDVAIEDFEKYDFPELYAEAKVLFDNYSVIMLDYYRNHVKAMPGAEDVFEWCHQNDIKVATDTGFHNDVNRTIIDSLEWQERGLVDVSVDVEMTQGTGRPAPYMLFYAMQQLGVQSVHEVVKIGDTPADLLSGHNGGCRYNIGVLSGANDRQTLEKHPHTHIFGSVAELPQLLEQEA